MSYAKKMLAFTKQAKKEEGLEETLNEDCVYVENDFGFVMDGATGLTKDNITPCKTDARWYVQTFKQLLIQKLKDKNVPLKDILTECVITVSEKYKEFKGSNDVKSKPSSAIAVFRVFDDYIEFFVLGDCSFVIKNTNDEIQILTRTDITMLDAKNAEIIIQRAKEHKVDIVNARELIADELLKTRLSQNTENGYWILADNPTAIKYGEYKQIKKDTIKQILAMSDGYSQICDLFKLHTQKELADLIAGGKTPQELYQELYNAQEKDYTCNNYPRFKLRDDATILDYEL